MDGIRQCGPRSRSALKAGRGEPRTGRCGGGVESRASVHQQQRWEEGFEQKDAVAGGLLAPTDQVEGGVGAGQDEPRHRDQERDGDGLAREAALQWAGEECGGDEPDDDVLQHVVQRDEFALELREGPVGGRLQECGVGAQVEPAEDRERDERLDLVPAHLHRARGVECARRPGHEPDEEQHQPPAATDEGRRFEGVERGQPQEDDGRGEGRARQRSAAAWRGGRRGDRRVPRRVRCGISLAVSGDGSGRASESTSEVSGDGQCGECGRHSVNGCGRVPRRLARTPNTRHPSPGPINPGRTAGLRSGTRAVGWSPRRARRPGSAAPEFRGR